MKRTGLVLLAIFLTSVNTSFSQEKNKEVMIKKIFTVLAEGDEQGFVYLFPDAKIIKKFMIEKLANDTANGNADEMKDFLDGFVDSSMQIELGNDFNKYILLGENHGVNWSKAVFVSYTADSITTEENGMKAPMLEGKIYFDVGDVNYFLAYNQVIWFDNKGWYGVSIDRIDLKSRESEEVGYDWDGKPVDTTLMVMDSVVAVTTVADTNMTVITAEKSPLKSKTSKQPVKSKSTKTKLQTPIRKED